MPETLRQTDCIIITLLLCLLLLMAFRRLHRSRLSDAVSNFFYPSNIQKNEVHSAHQEGLRAIAAILFCLEGAVFTYAYTISQGFWSVNLSPWLFIAGTSGFFMLFLILKQILYSMVHSVFFSKAQRQKWRDQYVFLFFAESLLLFPLLLAFIYLDINLKISLYGVALLLLFVKIMLLFKCFSTFFKKFYGILHLFVYFCALEVAPLVVLWTILVEITNRLTTIW